MGGRHDEGVHGVLLRGGLGGGYGEGHLVTGGNPEGDTGELAAALGFPTAGKDGDYS